MPASTRKALLAVLALAATATLASRLSTAQPAPAQPSAAGYNATAEARRFIATLKVQPDDWPQWGGSGSRNNTPAGKNIPTDWSLKTGRNIKWAVPLGSQSYGNPVVANGQVYVGTNDATAYVPRFSRKLDLGCLITFDTAGGQFLWQHSNTKHPVGRAYDWPELGVYSVPFVDGEWLWYISNLGQVCCLDTRGFRDDENDGPVQDEPFTTRDDADVVWTLDMLDELHVSPHSSPAGLSYGSVTAVGGVLFANTANGVDESHVRIPQPEAPSFIALDQATGRVLWIDNSPGLNLLRGQWSSPAYGVFAGQAQVLFAGGDGWLYSFDPRGDGQGKSKLLWKFDCNPKETKHVLGGRGTRNQLVATPVVYDGLVYIGVGEDPEHGEGVGRLWCIDPAKRGDVSPELVVNTLQPDQPVPARRLQAVDRARGEVARENPNSAAVWHYFAVDSDQNQKLEFEETMHRTCGTVAIQNGLLFVADFSGLFHCVDAKTGRPYWTHDLLAAAWGSPLLVDGHVYIGDEDGDVTVLKVSREREVVAEINMGNTLYTTPIVAGNVLYIATKDRLFAIEEGAKTDPGRINKRYRTSADE